MNADVQKSMGPLSVLMADLGGSAAGTAAMTLQQLQVGAAVMSKQQAKIWQDAGLLDMSKAHATGFGGGKLQLDPGALKGSLETIGNLPEWIEKYIRPGLMKLAGGDHNLFESYLGKAMPNRNAQKLAEMFGDPGFLDQIAKDMGLAAQVRPIGQAYQSFVNNNPTGIEAAYEAQKKSMIEAIGSPMMQAAIPVMKSITEMFQRIGAFANANPAAIKTIAQVVGAVAAASVVLGGVAIGAGIAALVPGGAIITGMIALGAAATGLYGVFAKIDPTIGGLVKTIVGSIDSGMNSIGYKIMDSWKSLANSFNLSFDWLRDKIVGAWDNLKSMIPGLGGTAPAAPGTPWNHQIQGPKQHSSLVPPPRQLAVNIPVTVQLDSRKMASVTMNHVVASATYPTSASGMDTRRTWAGPSYNPTEAG